MNFYDLDEDARHSLLMARRGGIKSLSRKVDGMASTIYWFHHGQNVHPSHIVAKVPATKKIDAGEQAKRFLREVKLQAGLFYNQFIHQPVDFDVIMGAPVAWFRGWHGDLSDWILRTDFGLADRVAHIAYLVTALKFAHARGLVAHQDLKPENIFVRDYRVDFSGGPKTAYLIPKLADFGSANLASETGIYAGTKAYMAPEQWWEQPLGQHTSVWSIGLIGHELLSYGRHAVGEASKDWHDRVNPQFNRWQKKQMWRRWVDEGATIRIPLENSRLDALIKRCLNVDPTRRPSLDSVLAELLNILHELDPSTSVQCQLILNMPESGMAYDDEWTYREERLVGFERALQREYPSFLPSRPGG